MVDFTKNTTKDGSLSLYSFRYQEGFHDTGGALKESINKYLLPAQLEVFSNHEKIVVLDVCMGMGYNTGCILEGLLKRNQKIEWHGLEIDQRPLNIALNEKIFQKIWSSKVLHFFHCLNKSGKWTEGFNEGTVHWGDARHKIYEIQDSLRFDLILLDPFSPQKCPELWSEEFISTLTERLSTEGRLITYSTAASIRASFKRAGLKIYSTVPSINDQNKWSLGTVAMKKKIEQNFISKDCQLKELSTREIEHLATRSSIPYRDPTGKGNSKEIISARELEQSKSQLINTSLWRKRWNTAQ
ncbi:MnmC family methyltransferase [Prochlorococcus sp. MIT 0916]|uniref:MnmC family methyltransferase n=1 Tax=Prochlorococcus sp. MIT 0916 TaxID=3082521 RepID=UPI0039B518FA